MNTLFNVFSPFIKSVGGYAIALLIGVSIGFGLHWKIATGDAAKKEVSVLKAQSEKREEQETLTQKIQVQYIDRIKVVEKEGKEITKYVPIYLDNTMLPGNFRLLHDSAVFGRVPDAAGSADAASVSIRTATETITDNYTTCRKNAEQLTALQDWVRGQRGVGK